MMRTLPLILAAGLLLAGPAHGLNDGLGEPPSDVDRSTPLATVQGFQASAHKGDYATAAHYLALDWVPKDRQKAEGARLARRLRFVMDRKLFLDLGAISKEPEGDPSKPGFDQLGTLQLENRKIRSGSASSRSTGSPRGSSARSPSGTSTRSTTRSARRWESCCRRSSSPRRSVTSSSGSGSG